MSRKKPLAGASRLSAIRERAPIVAKRGREFYRELELRRRRAERAQQQEPEVTMVVRSTPVPDPSTFRMLELDELLGIKPRPVDRADSGFCPRCGRGVGLRGDGKLKRHRLERIGRSNGDPKMPWCEESVAVVGTLTVDIDAGVATFVPDDDQRPAANISMRSAEYERDLASFTEEG